MTHRLLSDLCAALTQQGFPARIEGVDRTIHGVNTIDDAGDGEITFLSNPKYLAAVANTRASAVIAREDVQLPPHVTAVRCADPYAAVTAAIILLHGFRRHPQWGVSERAAIDPTARVGQGVNIASGVTLAPRSVVGDGSTLYPGCYIGEEAQIGSDCILFPNVVVYDRCVLGNRVTIHAGSSIGEDGLGYAPLNDQWVKIPQTGRAIIGDDVEIGANCAIDRATLGATVIESGTKFGNAVVIGHGTKVGRDCLFVGLVGLAGSVTVGRHVTLAGQVGAAGHITIGDNASVGAQAGIAGDVPPNAKLLGSPAVDADLAKRALIAGQKLPDWIRRVKDLEREVRMLREQMGADRKT